MSVGREPGQGKYARSERERRWLVPSVPAAAGRPRRITDRYLLGTSLRLRRVADATAVAYKLGQKVRPVPEDPSLVLVTNLYLNEAEYRRLAVLPAAVLDKTRWLVPHGGATLAVDEFGGPLRGLVLAETEDPLTDLPPWLGREVTSEDRYSGAALAGAGQVPQDRR